jgi:hypothetical protein
MPPSAPPWNEAQPQRGPAVRGDEVLADEFGLAVDVLCAGVGGHRGDEHDRDVPDRLQELLGAAEVDPFDLGAVVGAQVVGAVDDRGHVVRQRHRGSILEGVGQVVPRVTGRGSAARGSLGSTADWTV